MDRRKLASRLDAYVADRSAATRRQRALAGWQAHAARLEQERAAAAAELWAAVEAGAEAALLLDALEQSSQDADAEEEQTGNAAEGEEARGISGQSNGMNQQREWARLAARASRLEAQARAHAVAAQAPGPPPPLEPLVRRAVEQQSLAHPEVAEQLLAGARQLQAAHERRRGQATAALRAFLGRASGPAAAAPASARDPDPLASGMELGSGGDCILYDGAAERGAGEGAAGGWSAAEHAAWLRARAECAARPAPLAERCQQRLPHRSPQELAEHEAWHAQASRLRSELAACLQTWREDVPAYLAAASDMLAESAAGILAGADAAARQLEATIACVRSAGALDRKQSAQAVRELGAADERVAAAAAAAAAEREAAEAERERRDRLKQLIQQHREAQRQLAEEREAAAAAAAAAGAAEAAALATASRERVVHRQQALQEAGAARAAAAAAVRRSEEARAASLAREAAAAAPRAERDAARARGPTASSAATASRKGAVFREVFGWTSEELLQDQRVRLFEALAAAGLHRTPAGRDALRAACPARPARADALTSAQRQQLGQR
eukprot:scaffold22.g6082.t1